MRDRLIELIRKSGCVDTWNYHADDFKEPNPINEFADYLLANGVIVPPCKVGDKIFAYMGCGTIIAAIVTRIETTETPNGTEKNCFAIGSDSPSVKFNDECIGKTVFLRREEAEAALKGGE